MEKKINNVLLFTGRDGSQLTFRVLFTHYSEKFKKDYAVFYNEADENHLILYSFDENNTLYNVDNPEEIDELEEALHRFDEEEAVKNNK